MSHIAQPNKSAARFAGLTAVFLVLTVVLGRVTSYFLSVSATDVAVADWVSTALSYLGEVLSSTRVVLSYTAVGYAAYRMEKRDLRVAVILSASAALLDYAARFAIDLAMGSLDGMETVAVLWLLLQLAYEWLFLALAVTATLLLRGKYRAATHPRIAARFDALPAIRVALGLMLLSRIALEGYYLVDFLLTYSDITNTEIASMVGQFLKIFVIYGGIAFVTAEGFYALYAKTTGIAEKSR